LTSWAGGGSRGGTSPSLVGNGGGDDSHDGGEKGNDGELHCV